jgi:ABC-type sugar transport system permease subunit
VDPHPGQPGEGAQDRGFERATTETRATFESRQQHRIATAERDGRGGLERTSIPAVSARALGGRASREAVLGWAMVSPCLVLLGTFVVGPALLDFPLSLMRYDIIAASGAWAGLANYRALFADPAFWQSVAHTLELTLGATVPMLVLALVFGIALNRRIGGRGLYRTVLFAPYVIPLVASSIAWIWMLSSDGFVNYLLHVVARLRGPAWLDSDTWALPAIVLMTVWQFTGYYTVLVLSGLQNIPHEIEEAARIDGAGEFRLAWSVLLPLLSPTLLFCIVVSVIHSFRVFDQIYVMTGGGPGTATMTLVYYLYQQGFAFFNTGQGASVSVLLLIFLMGITGLQLRLARRWVNYEL